MNYYLIAVEAHRNRTELKICEINALLIHHRTSHIVPYFIHFIIYLTECVSVYGMFDIMTPWQAPATDASAHSLHIRYTT